MRLFTLYYKMSGSNVRFRSPVDFPVYVRFSSAQKFTVQVAHYVDTFVPHHKGGIKKL